MLPVANHLPLTFDTRSTAKSRIPARAREFSKGLLQVLAIAAVILAAVVALAWLL